MAAIRERKNGSAGGPNKRIVSRRTTCRQIRYSKIPSAHLSTKPGQVQETIGALGVTGSHTGRRGGSAGIRPYASHAMQLRGFVLVAPVVA